MEFITWENLGSMAGATIIITVLLSVVQYIFGTINERLRNGLVTLVAVALLVITAVSVGGTTWQGYVVAAINGLIVSLAVLRLYDTSIPRAKVLASKGD